MALQRKVDVGRRQNLADLCLHLLGQRLKKDQHLRLSRWNVAELREEQRGYAARDAYASYVLYGRISELSDPIFRESEELHPGDSVRLYTRDGNECVGEGCIIEYGKETWGSTGIFLAPRRATRGLTRRWVVRLSRVLVPLESTLYPEETDAPRTQPTTQVGGRLGENLLWDADRMRKTVGMTPSPAAAAGHGGGPNAGGGAASSTAGSSGAAVTGLPGFVTPSEPLFAGELAGVEALSESASSLAVSARAGEMGRRETEVERSETERGVGEMKLDEPMEAEDHIVAEAGPDGQGEAEGLLEMGQLRLKLDPFHAMQRLSKLVHKSHGACGAYMARLRDALSMVHSEDLAAVEAALRLLGKTPAEIEEKKKTG
eukprot:jgi/Undpi1/10753/HiC_scaffold_29.g13201.m1